MRAFVISVAWLGLLFLLILRILAPEKYEQLRVQAMNEVQAITEKKEPPPPLSSKDISQACATAPPAHGQHLVPLNGTTDAGVSLANELSYPVVALFTGENGEEVGAITVYPRNTVHTRMVSGEFSLALLVGRQWCDLSTGFVDGVVKEAPQTITLRAGDMKGVRFSPLGEHPEDILFSFRNGMEGNGRVEGSGNLTLQPVVGGQYAVDGTINQKPITFLLDTGATVVAVSRTFAAHAGLSQCKPYRTSTANGVVNACLATAKEMSIGHFHLSNVEVAILDNLPGAPLLGMNVIGRFRMEMRNGDMLLSAY